MFNCPSFITNPSSVNKLSHSEEHLESTKQLKDFEQIFNKLKTEYKHKLIDTSDDEDNDDNDDNDNNDKMEIINKQ